MTKTDERLLLVERQRRFEWQLARDVHSRAAAHFVAGKTHDLLNLVQIVQLASAELTRRCGSGDAAEFIADIIKASVDAQHQLAELMAVARPEEVIVAGAPVGAAITAAVDTVRAASTIAVDLHLTARPAVTTRCSATELAHLVYGLALDAAPAAGDEPAVGDPTGADPRPAGKTAGVPSPRDPASPIELFVRERTIDGKPWLEIVRGARVGLDGEHFDLRAVEAIAIKNGGELASSEVVVALPLVVPAALPAPS
jgi:ActR/RegA family two-component response regulator